MTLHGALLLVRHGESRGNVSRVIQGQADLPLTDRGQRQAVAVARRLAAEAEADRIVASPLRRAFATAEAIATFTGLPLTTDDRLMEYDFGEISGLSVAEARKRYPAFATNLFANEERALIPGEEGLAAFDARVAEVVAELIAGEGRTIAVTHGGVIMSALNTVVRMHAAAGADAARLRFPTKNCGITELDRDEGGRLILRRHNDACHVTARA